MLLNYPVSLCRCWNASRPVSFSFHMCEQMMGATQSKAESCRSSACVHDESFFVTFLSCLFQGLWCLLAYTVPQLTTFCPFLYPESFLRADSFLPWRWRHYVPVGILIPIYQTTWCHSLKGHIMNTITNKINEITAFVRNLFIGCSQYHYMLRPKAIFRCVYIQKHTYENLVLIRYKMLILWAHTKATAVSILVF
jgi:hypothetical protein